MRPSSKRLGAAILALVFGAVGVVTLVRYVQTAEDRALEGQQLVDVVVVTEPIDAGTPVDELDIAVESRQVPASTRTPGAVTDLTSLDGLVASVDLVPGEQLLAARFEERYTRTVAGRDLAIPPGLIEVTIRLSPDRAVGAQITPGEKVAVIATFDSIGNIDGVEDVGVETPTPGTVTGTLLRQVLVTNVQAAAESAVAASETERSRQVAETLNMFVTVAVEPAQAERLVFAAEKGSIWIARESAGEALESGPLMSEETVFDGALTEALTAARTSAAEDGTEDGTEDEGTADEGAADDGGTEGDGTEGDAAATSEEDGS